MANSSPAMITFLFIDVQDRIKQSTPAPPRAGAAPVHYSTILQQAINACGGTIFKTSTDSVYAAFPAAPAALAAGLAAYWTLSTTSWGDIGLPQIRMALHTGPAGRNSTAYVGSTFNHAVSLLAACQSGQILLSRMTYGLVGDHVPAGTELRDLGEHRLKDMTRPEHIFQLVPHQRPADLMISAAPAPFPVNLPVLPTPLIGRDREVIHIRSILQQPDLRILTLLGSSGTGKTRLSLQVAVEMAGEFADGVYFVPLAPIGTPKLVASAIAHALNIKEVGDKPLIETLHDYLRERQILLVLDNFEQLLDSGPLIEGLLAAAPGLKTLVTSQASLGLTNEYVFPVPPLALPDLAHLPRLDQLMHYPSIALFLERAQVVQPNFTLTPANAAVAAELCVSLGGVPLAIELVAAHSDQFSAAEMLAQVRQRMTAERERTGEQLTQKQMLRAVLGWSYGLLDNDAQVLFARMGAFEGGCTAEAVEAICDPGGELAIDIPSRTALLLNKNLLVQEEWRGSEPRYMMLDLIHQFTRARLAERGEEEIIRRWHAAYNLTLAEKAEAGLTGAQQELWLQRLEGDLHNLRAALGWSIEHAEAETAVRLSGSLWRFWYIHGYLSEGRRWLTTALAASPAVPPALRTKALTGASVLSFIQGDYEHAKRFSEENLTLFRQLGDKRGVANTLSNLGAMSTEHGDYAQAKLILMESLQLRREIGDRWGIAAALNNLGRATEGEGDHAEAEALYTESLALFRELADKSNVATLTGNLGWMALAQGNYERAKQFFKESLIVSQELGFKEGIASILLGAGHLAAVERRPVPAARLFGAVDRICQQSDIQLSAIERARYNRARDITRVQVDEPTFANAWTEGQVLSPDQAVGSILG